MAPTGNYLPGGFWHHSRWHKYVDTRRTLPFPVATQHEIENNVATSDSWGSLQEEDSQEDDSA